jgi:hypothetical protein
MSNTLVQNFPTSIPVEEIKHYKTEYLTLIAQGYSEAKALSVIQMPRGQYVRICQEDPEFVKQIEDARKHRAEFWVSKIAENIDVPVEKENVPSEKLKLEKLIFLAKADNPERYGTGKTKVDISLDLKQFKLLPPDEAVKALANDPFAIEAEYKEIKDEKDLL